MDSYTRILGTRTLRRVSCIAPLLLLVTLPAQSRAAGYFLCSDGNNYTRTTSVAQAARWRTTSMTLNRSTISFPSASGPAEQAITRARIRWNDGPQNFTITPGITSREFIGPGDGFSDIAWFPSLDWLCPGLGACTPLAYNCQSGIREADVLILQSPGWSFTEDKIDHTPYGGLKSDFAAMVVHELGHLLGLAHTATVYNSMGETSTHVHVNDRRSVAYPGEDATVGAMRLYPLRPGARADYAVSHWRLCDPPIQVPNQDPYSNHCFVRMFDSANNFVPSVALTDLVVGPRQGPSEERVYRVRRNQVVKIEFTLENNGAVAASNVVVGFYISTNDAIVGSDFRFSHATFNITRDLPRTELVTLKIPAVDENGNELVRDQIYYIGAWVDDTLSHSESDENNATYVPIQIID